MLPFAFVVLDWTDQLSYDNEWTEVIPVMPGDYVDEVLDAVRVTLSPEYEVFATVVYIVDEGERVGPLEWVRRCGERLRRWTHPLPLVNEWETFVHLDRVAEAS